MPLPLVTLTENVNLDQKLQTGTATAYVRLDHVSHFAERPLMIHRNASDDTFNLEIPVQTNITNDDTAYETPYINLNNKLEISGKSSISEQVIHNALKPTDA